MISEIDTVLLSVANMAESIELYSSLRGWEIACQYSMGGADVGALWGMPKESVAQVALLQNKQASTGKIKLVEVADGSRVVVRDPHRPWDLGLLAMDMMVKDIKDRCDKLIGRGMRSASPSTVLFSDELLELENVLMYGPNNEALVLLEVLKSPPALSWPLAPDEGYSEVVTSAQVVADLERTISFYTHALGFNVWLSVDLRSPQMDAMLALPPGTRIKVATLAAGDSLTGKIELIEFPELKGRELAKLAGPPNIGFFMLSFLVDDIDRVHRQFVEYGATIMCPPCSIEYGTEGLQKVMSILSPDGVKLEFRER